MEQVNLHKKQANLLAALLYFSSTCGLSEVHVLAGKFFCKFSARKTRFHWKIHAATGKFAQASHAVFAITCI